MVVHEGPNTAVCILTLDQLAYSSHAAESETSTVQRRQVVRVSAAFVAHSSITVLSTITIVLCLEQKFRRIYVSEQRWWLVVFLHFFHNFIL